MLRKLKLKGDIYMDFGMKMQYIETLHKIGVHPDIIVNSLALMELNHEFDFIGKSIMEAAAQLNALRAIKEGVQDVQG
jgi:hypothetical protein